MPSSSTVSGHRQRTPSSNACNAPSSTSLAHHQTRLGDPFEPCTATASFFLYAQRNVIRCLHHDTLAIERKFEKHNADVLLLSADNISERGAGRLIVSYDAEQTAIIWDLLTGDEVARFASYEIIRVIAWLKDGTIAFGNCQGNIILFDPSVSEHVSARTIFDPITALAPASDCTTFAIGYQNGSVLIASLQPSFTILHTLSTPRVPSPITGLAWHNSSSKQKTEMLATQAADGDLRIWSVSKAPSGEQPRVIRVLGPPESLNNHRNWFAWSKNGRIVQFCNGDARIWDVRTKKVACEVIPTIDDVLAITAFGPAGTVFTVGRSYSVQQYDLITHRAPIMVKNVQHAPPNAPPTPPDLIDESKRSRTVPVTILPDEPTEELPIEAESSEEEGGPMSPLQKIARHEQHHLEDESRDQLGSLSPMSSRGSQSSASSHGRRRKQYSTPRQPLSVSGSSCLSVDSSARSGYDSASIRSGSSAPAQKSGASALRFEVMRSPEEPISTKLVDLFPFVKARLSEVKFRSPQYNSTNLTPDVLRNEMLRIVFGWDNDIEALIRDEQNRHRSGSASSVLLSKWLGDLGADTLTQMIGSESMTSSDWMLLALSCQMGEGSQKKVGEAFVRRLLETGEVHPAVAILLGLGEPNEAVEVYVSRQMYLEAVLLTCLIFSNDWQRQSHLVRKWGESAVSTGQPELAVRCFSCTTLESSQAWFSPRSQDAVYQAQHRALASQTLSPPISPPSATGASRMTAKKAPLTLITQFNDEYRDEPQQMTATGITPIMDSAITPNTNPRRRKDISQGYRDRSQSRTATPGGIGRSRLPSTTRTHDDDITPLGTSRVHSRLATPAVKEMDTPTSAVEVSQLGLGRIQTPVTDTSLRQRAASSTRNTSRNRNGLQIAMKSTVDATGGPSTGASAQSAPDSVARSTVSASRSIDRRMESVEPVGNSGNQHIADQYSRERSRSRKPGKSGRSRSGARDTNSDMPAQMQVLTPSKQSPTSPIPMTADEVSGFTPLHNNLGTADRRLSMTHLDKSRTCVDYSAAWSGSPGSRLRGLNNDETWTREGAGVSKVQPSAGGEQAGSHRLKHDNGQAPSSQISGFPETAEDFYRRPVSRSRQDSSAAQSPMLDRTHTPAATQSQTFTRQLRDVLGGGESTVQSEPFSYVTRPRTKKELAAKELEDRRLSLARRPSVPNIPHPADLSSPATRRPPRSGTDPFLIASAASFADVQAIARSQTAGPEYIRHQPNILGQLRAGLPVTPKAMQRQNPPNTDKDSYFQQTFTPKAADAQITLAPATYQAEPKAVEAFGPLLPSTVYSKPPITRSISAPPEQLTSVRRLSNDSSSHRLHVRKGSAIAVIPEVSASFEAGLHDDADIIIVSQSEPATWESSEAQEDDNPPMLAELAHLAGPPPPPPPPTMFRPISSHSTSGVIDIVMDDEPSGRTSTSTTTPPPPPPMTSMFTPISPNNYSAGNSAVARRRTPANETIANSGSSGTTPTTGSGIGSKFRNVADRIRSSSRNRTRSPPTPQDIVSPFSASSPAPYETITGPPPSSYFQQQYYGTGDRRTSMDYAPGAGSPPAAATPGGYRHPREIRANMPPEMFLPGVDMAKMQKDWIV